VTRKMRIGITYRLFLSILASTCLALLCMFLITQWSIGRGFLQYLNTLDKERLEGVAEKLARAYADHENWGFLQENPRFWMEGPSGPEPWSPGPGGFREASRRGEEPPPPPPPRPGPPITILDAEGNPFVGHAPPGEETILRPIIHKNRTVGYVGLVLPPKQFLNPQQVHFLSSQKTALIVAAFVMVLVVAMFSFPLANRLIRPIRAMVVATGELASGTYTVRIPVTSSDELGQLGHAFNAMALSLEKNEETRRQWVADISHELRTPIAVLRGEVEALMDGIRPTTPEAISSLHSEILRLHRLVDDLYQLALSDVGAMTYRQEDVELPRTLGKGAEIYRAEFARKGIRFGTDIPQRPGITMVGDSQRLEQLFANLFDNSLRYTDAGGEFFVRLALRAGQAIVEFEDSAPGVPDSELERLFERLYRLEGSRSRATGGAGLGLAICRNIVEAHGGSITAQPSPLRGILIRVLLPAGGKDQ
jgi:two-component system, OmpR family, sensor histidine kinase BaeS